MELTKIYYTDHVWYLPERIAFDFGFFENHKLNVELVKFDPTSTENPDLFERDNLKGFLSGEVGIYSACTWGTIQRVHDSRIGKVAIKRGIAMNTPYKIFVAKESQAKMLQDLSSSKIAIKNLSGSHYITLEAIEEFFTNPTNRLVHVGAVGKRLSALINGNVEAATLVGPSCTIAELLGFRSIHTMPTGGALVTSRHMNSEKVGKYISALNDAVSYINQSPNDVRTVLEEIAAIEFAEISDVSEIPFESVLEKLEVPKYDSQFSIADPNEISKTVQWMSNHNFLPKDIDFEFII
ncbi:MAG: hypothetical protein AAFQ94_02565 [Bacteroidota bacterium]